MASNASRCNQRKEVSSSGSPGKARWTVRVRARRQGDTATPGCREAGSDAWKADMRRQTETVDWSRSMPFAQEIEFNVG